MINAVNEVAPAISEEESRDRMLAMLEEVRERVTLGQARALVLVTVGPAPGDNAVWVGSPEGPCEANEALVALMQAGVESLQAEQTGGAPLGVTVQ